MEILAIFYSAALVVATGMYIYHNTGDRAH